MAKPSEQHQFDLLQVPKNVFKGIVYKYVLTDTDVASRYKVERALNINKSSDVVPQVFQYDNWSEFRSGVTMLLKKHDADI